MSEIELNNFAERALQRVSPIYENSLFMQSLFNAVGTSYVPIRELFKTFNKQTFIESVTYCIALEERKYGLEPRPDLTLEERRARLGIRAALHRPLNPKTLENAIKKYYDVATYLDEKKAGWIRVYFNQITQAGYNGMINFLLEEKPAHLCLELNEHIVVPVSGEEEGDDDDDKKDDDKPIIKPDDDAFPISQYPKIYAGVAQVFGGAVDIQLAKPTNEIYRARAGIAQLMGGTVQIQPARPENPKVELHAGGIVNIGGEIIIKNVDEPLPPPRIRENPTPRLAVVGGKIPVRRPQPVLMRSLKAAPTHSVDTFGAIARGKYSFTPPPDDFDELQGDIVKIFFGFPVSKHRRVRGVAMPNARQDLTKAEIKAVGQFAVDNKLILNERGEVASGVIGGAIKYKDVYEIF